MKPSEVHARTLRDASAWYSKMGVANAYNEYKTGKITAGQYIVKHQYAKNVMTQAMKAHRANPHIKMSLVDHADAIHKKNLEKEANAKAAARKKKSGSKK